MPNPKKPEYTSAEDLARNFITDLAEKCGQDFDGMMRAAEKWIKTNDYTYDNSEDYKGVRQDQWDQFWVYYAALTGRRVEARDRHGFFTCSC